MSDMHGIKHETMLSDILGNSYQLSHDEIDYWRRLSLKMASLHPLTEIECNNILRTWVSFRRPYSDYDPFP